MQLDPLTQFRLVLSTEEFRLVNKALMGTLKASERAAALELAYAMADKRISKAEQYHREMMKLKDSLEAIHQRKGGTDDETEHQGT